MPENPRISVIMPCFNCGKYVAEAINSALNQTLSPFEIICINDASTDNTLEILKSFGDKIKVINNETNIGTAKSRNKAINISSGEYLALLDGDDIWMPEKLEKQIDQFIKDPELDMAFCIMENFFSPDLTDEEKTKRHCPPPMDGYSPTAAFIKRSSFDRVGEMSPAFKVGEFVDWLARAKSSGLKSFVVPEILVMRRIHSTNISITSREERRVMYIQAAREMLARKRNQ